MSGGSWIDWTAVMQSVLTTAVAVGIIGFIAREVFKSSMNHAFDRQMEIFKSTLSEKLEEHKADLARKGALEVERRGQAHELTRLLADAGKRARNVCEALDRSGGEAPDASLLEELKIANRELEAGLYKAKATVQEVSTGLYGRIHDHKNELIALGQNARNMRGWIEKGDHDKARDIGKSLQNQSATLHEGGEALAKELTEFAQRREE